MLDERITMPSELYNYCSPQQDFVHQMEFINDVRQLKIESVRLDTFHCWSIMCPVRPEELARQGFYFTGTDDSVKCFCCHGQLNTWTAGDVVSTEHSKWYPDCPFIQGKYCGNVPMMRTHIKHPPYIMFYDRMESFREWHTANNLSADRMASAGFFQIAPFDHVKCFSCGIRLNKWLPENDPWEEHKKYSPNCPFLLERYKYYLGNDTTSEIVSFENLHIGNSENSKMVSQEETQFHFPQQETVPFQQDSPQPHNNDYILHAFAMVGHEPEPLQSSATLQPKAEASKERLDNLDMLGPEELKQIILEQEDERLCKICFERKLNIIFIPCNHMVCCTECGKQQQLCPICRRKIETVNQIYFS